MKTHILLSSMAVALLIGCRADTTTMWQLIRTDLLKDDGRVMEGVTTSPFLVKNDGEGVKGHVSFNKHELRYEFQEITRTGGVLVLTYPDKSSERFTLAVGETKDCFGMGQQIGVRIKMMPR
jgi:hypothetical protein